MKDEPLISVVMPVYNTEKFVAEAIESILAQTFTDFEIIIIDDCSTDKSWQIIQDFSEKDQRIVTIQNSENQGLARSLNKGLKIAKGQFIARMDADDISMPQRFEIQLDFLKNHPDVGVVGSTVKFINKNNSHSWHYDVPAYHSLIVWELAFGQTFAHPSVMMRADLIKKAGGYKCENSIAEDLELWGNLSSMTRFANIQKDLVIMHAHKKSTSHSRNEQQLKDALVARQKFIEFVIDKSISLEEVNMILSSQQPNHSLTDEQVNYVIGVINKLYYGLIKKGMIKLGEEELVLNDLANKVRNVLGFRPNTFYLLQKKIIDFLHLLKKAIRKRIIKFSNLFNEKIKEEKKNKSTADADIPLQKSSKGLSIIILSFKRVNALNSLLKSLIKQKYENIGVEIILCNNAEDVQKNVLIDPKIQEKLVEKVYFKYIGSSYNWKVDIRYALATIAKYETILFIDDDIHIDYEYFIYYMFNEFNKLRDIDILSCWNMIWTKFTKKEFCRTVFTFENPEITELTECDSVGPGICMFNRKLLLNSEVYNNVIDRDSHHADDMAFSVIAWLKFGSRSYHLPSYGMISFHIEKHKNALYKNPNIHPGLIKLFKYYYKNGYKPLITRKNYLLEGNSPEEHAINSIKPICYKW